MMLVLRQRLPPTGCESVSPPLGCLVNIRVFAAGFAPCLPGRLGCSECTFLGCGGWAAGQRAGGSPLTPKSQL